MERTLTIFYIAVIIVLTGCNNQTDWHRDGLNSKVKSVQELVYNIENRFGEWQKTELAYSGSHSLTEYDENGMKSSTSVLNSDLSIMYKDIISYENGLPKEEIFYDEDGRKVERTVIMNYSLDGWTFEVYDKDDNKLRFGHVILENNRVAKITSNSIEDNSKYITDYKYNDNGWVLEVIIYIDGEEEHLFHNSYEYLSTDEKGNWLERLHFRDDNEPLYMDLRTYIYY